MDNRYLFRGKAQQDWKTPTCKKGDWIKGYLCCTVDDQYWIGSIPISRNSIGQCTGLRDKDGTLIFESDILRLELSSDEVRCFEVAIRTVNRKVVSHPSFDEPAANVAITGVVFLWCGYELFPCVDADGVPDTARMEVVGNIHDNPELLKEV